MMVYYRRQHARGEIRSNESSEADNLRPPPAALCCVSKLDQEEVNRHLAACLLCFTSLMGVISPALFRRETRGTDGVYEKRPS
jgi:hypothetical protein